MKRYARCDAAGPLESDVKVLQIVLAKRPLHGSLDAKEHAKRSVWSWVASNVAGRVGQASDELGRARNLNHVGDAHPNVLCGNITSAEMVDGLTERVEHVRRL